MSERWKGKQAPGPGMTETLEPQGPTTEAGRWLLEWAATSAHMHRNSSSYDAIEARILAIEAEARAAAPPDIEALAIIAANNWHLRQFPGHTHDFAADCPEQPFTRFFALLAEARRLASPDATEKKPFEYENLGYAKGPGK